MIKKRFFTQDEHLVLQFCLLIFAQIVPQVNFHHIWHGLVVVGVFFGGGVPRGVLGSSFVGYVSLTSQNPYPIIVYSVANYRPHLSHFWANVNVISRTEFNASRLLNIKTTAVTIFNRESSYF